MANGSLPELIWVPAPGLRTSPEAAGDFRTGSPARLESAGESAIEKDSSLGLRIGFFREQWDIAGPGLLGAMVRRTGGRVPERIAVHCLSPALTGGPGAGSLGRDSCWCVAMLHDIDARIPETLRLGWALAMTLLAGTEPAGWPALWDGTRSTTPGPAAASLVLQSAVETGLIGPLDQATWDLALGLWGIAAPVTGADPEERKRPGFGNLP